jgi:hypothetical protein
MLPRIEAKPGKIGRFWFTSEQLGVFDEGLGCANQTRRAIDRAGSR